MAVKWGVLSRSRFFRLSTKRGKLFLPSADEATKKGALSIISTTQVALSREALTWKD